MKDGLKRNSFTRNSKQNVAQFPLVASASIRNGSGSNGRVGVCIACERIVELASKLLNGSNCAAATCYLVYFEMALYTSSKEPISQAACCRPATDCRSSGMRTRSLHCFLRLCLISTLNTCNDDDEEKRYGHCRHQRQCAYVDSRVRLAIELSAHEICDAKMQEKL